MNATVPARFVPPRSIPDPLPWPEASSWSNGLIPAAIGLAMLAGLIVALAILRRKRPGGLPNIAPAFPDGLVERAERIRSALVVRFGGAWAARTTEEIAGSPPLVDLFGPGPAGALVEYLRMADRAKFAPLDEPPRPDPAIHDDRWFAETLARLAG